MGVPGQLGARPVRCWLVVLALSGGSAWINAAGTPVADAGSWQAAVLARARFEAALPGTHTRASYAAAMDRFRAIYHGDPADPHAPQAVGQVAELLAEQGRELGDRKSLHDAAGQYEFLARAYPESPLAALSLQHAATLLEPGAANDPAELRRVEAELALRSPAAGRNLQKTQKAKGTQDVVSTALPPGHDPRAYSRAPTPQLPTPRDGGSGVPANDTARAAHPGSSKPAVPEPAAPKPAAPKPVPEIATASGPESARGTASATATGYGNHGEQGDAESPAPAAVGERATVNAIRHWSTPSYTRVAIDLGSEVQFEAARVQNPDRIFFDLHHARLTPQLVGKSFAVTDEGFLTRIRAAQFSDEVTRVVLDVHEVAEYSAFLLPNPYRLIIDIHGKAEGSGGSASRGPEMRQPAPADRGEAVEGVSGPGDGGTREQAGTGKAGTEKAGLASLAASRLPDAKPRDGDHYVPRRDRGVAQSTVKNSANQVAGAQEAGPAQEAADAQEAAGTQGITGMRAGRDPGERSSLPPMPVTDGGAAFGLPARRGSGSAGTSAAVGAPVAVPRVVIPSRPTTARPVPNTVATHSAAASTEVAAVSDQPGKVEATARPTSQPVVDVANRSVVATAEAPLTPGRGSRSTTVPGSKAASLENKIASSGKKAATTGSQAAPAVAAPPTAEGETSLLRALGLKIGRIVIDAGHGGHDSGTIGVDGLQEKDVVLDVALRLGKLLHDRLDAEIIYTRADDTFIPLETRTAIANKAQADLFISIHANSSPDPSARGVEVYYLNFTSDPEAMQVASRENAVSTKSVHELSELVRRITLRDKIEESHELASNVDSSLYAGLAKGSGGLKDRGVKKAPFVVLIGANMPSILAEISFVTNPSDANKLTRPDYRQRVAESLYAGVARYAGEINGRRSATGLQTAER